MARNISDVEVDTIITVYPQSHISRTFVFSSATPPEVEMFIDQLNVNKTCRSVDTPTKFIDYGKSVIAQFQCIPYYTMNVSLKVNTLIYLK